MITISVSGLNEIVRLATLPSALERRVILGLSQVAYDAAQADAAKHTKTGALFRSLYNRAAPSIGGTARAVGHDTQAAPQAWWVNRGTPPHVIKPRHKKALRWAVGGRFIFARQVNHPGYKGDPYIIRAADAAVQQYPSIVDDAFRRSV